MPIIMSLLLLIVISVTLSVVASHSSWLYKVFMIPRYMKPKYFVLMHSINGVLSVGVILLLTRYLGHWPNSIMLLIACYPCLLLSANLTRAIAKQKNESPEETIEEEQERKRKMLD
jgi:hypothetical protein